MILTNKAKEDFIDYLWESKFKKEDYKEYEDYIENQKESHTYADIIEWFDSVGVYIYLETGMYFNKPNFRYKIITNDDTCIGYKEYSRQEATIQAITKANEIYNERLKQIQYSS